MPLGSFDKDTPTVSMIIPCWNGEKFIDQTIKSALSQSFRDFEIIVVDDKSTDSTVDIVSTYLNRGIRYYQNVKRVGLAQNWNRGLELARGEFIKFLFQDDLLRVDALGEMVRVLRNFDNVGLVGAKIRFIDEKCDEIETTKTLGVDGNQVCDGVNSVRLSVTSWRNFFGNPSSVMFRRCLVEQVGGFDPALSYSVDRDMWLRILGRSAWYYIDKELVLFRVHRDSETSRIIANRMRTNDHLKLATKVFSNPSFYGTFSRQERRLVYRRLLQRALKDGVRGMREGQVNVVFRNSIELGRAIPLLF